ncbi:hypothetical protein HY479_02490 [Candidatus Uhrbacteria bacterium]|nr:hypothetical protein [Candidatus Uhrbacteria bacterium]
MTISRFIAVPILAVPWIAAGVFFGWIFLKRVPPSGEFVVTSQLDGKSPFADPFLPSERVTPPGAQPEGWKGQRITGDPTYFSARVPGPYASVEVAIEFRPVRQPLIEFGLVRDADGKDLDLEPMYFEGLQHADWTDVPGGYVRTGTSASRLQDPDPTGLAVWDASATMPLLMDPAGPTVETSVSLRGAHDLYVVPADGRLELGFGLQDVNRKRGTTVVAFRVFRGEEEIRREAFTTNASREQAMGKVTEHRISMEARPGVYRVSVQADDDVFIRSLRTPSRRWVVGPRLNVGDVVGFATTTFAARVWTNSRHVVAETFHREGLQTVALGDATVRVVRTHEPFRLDRFGSAAKPVPLVAPLGDIRFVGDGWFAYSPAAFFEPKPRRVTDGSDLKNEGIIGVRTAYSRPEALGDGWFAARFSYSLDGTNDRLRAVLSAPGIAARAGAVDIRKISLTYRRPPLSWEAWWQIVRQEIRNAWRRIRS